MAGYPRLVIAGTQSSVGKTTIAAGLMAVLAQRLRVQPYKVGPDYIDPAYHTLITGRKSRNLDSWLLSEEALLYLFAKNAAGADIAIVEGVMGLYDAAQTGEEQGSTAHVAKIMRAPVVLVLDGSGMAASAAAMVKGYKEFDPGLKLGGVILNRVGGTGHYQILKEAIEGYTGVKVLGYLPSDLEIQLPSRHLGLVPSGEITSLRDKIAKLAELVSETVDIEGLLSLALNWPEPLPHSNYCLELLYEPRSIPLAVAYDEAFNFYYWDNLELLEELGARLEFFSPRKDRGLPRGVGGLLLGGGVPEVFAGELQDNGEMRRSVRQALEEGLPYVAECGGLMYLLEKLSDLQGREFQMVGWLKGQCRMTRSLQRFGYAELQLAGDSVYGQPPLSTRAHEFHYSQVESSERRVLLLRQERRGRPARQWECGYAKGAGVAGYAHLHYYANPALARNFLRAAREYLDRQAGEEVSPRKGGVAGDC